MSRLSLVPAAALVAAALTTLPTAAQAAVTLDCSAGPVTISSSTESYVLTGACSQVTITASNVDVTLSSAMALSVSGANVDVFSAGRIDVLTLTDAVSSVTAPEAGTATVRSSNVDLRIGTVEQVKLVGANNSVKATKGKKAKVKGANNELVYDKLETLKITGANNSAKVRKGSTKVRVHGPNNVVTVHRKR